MLSVLSFAPGVHPLAAYTELCRIVGQLSSSVRSGGRPRFPPTTTTTWRTIFRYIRDQILLLLKLIPVGGYVRRDFVGEGLGMRVKLESEWLGNEWRWFVGVLRQNLDERECVVLLEQRGLDWKLGSAQQVDELFRLGMEGLRLERLPQAPQALPPRRDWLYFEVIRDNAAWRDVVQDANPCHAAEGQHDRQPQGTPGRKEDRRFPAQQAGRLQFALFAVPNPKAAIMTPEMSDIVDPGLPARDRSPGSHRPASGEGCLDRAAAGPQRPGRRHAETGRTSRKACWPARPSSIGSTK